MLAVDIFEDDPLRSDVTALLERHLEFSHDVTPAGHVHALPVNQLVEANVTFYSARQGEVLLGVGALKELGPEEGEVKSMHTTAAARRQGIGRAMMTHLIAVSRARGYRYLRLETGAMNAFAPARSLYRSVGFKDSEPFGSYTRNPHSVCMVLDLTTAE